LLSFLSKFFIFPPIFRKLLNFLLINFLKYFKISKIYLTQAKNNREAWKNHT
jgi:hypothetical protein